MSVVCYDGEYLAGDRKSRVTGKDGVKRVKSLTQEKITADFKKTIFDGEEVYAVGRAGRLRVTKEMIRHLRRSKDLAKTLKDTLGSKLRKAFEDGGMGPSSLLIVTSDHVHHVKVNSKFEVTWKKEHRSKKMAIGSGARIALFLMEHQGLSAIDAVAAMELHHPCCGGGVTYTSRLQSASDEPIRALTFSGRRTLVRHFLKSTIESAKNKLVSLPNY